jgi:hypothetical protein
MPKTMKELWESYVAEVLPKDAPPIQRQECRRAFYAGAVAVFGLLTNSVGVNDEDPTAEELAAIGGIAEELNVYLDEVTKEAKAADGE